MAEHQAPGLRGPGWPSSGRRPMTTCLTAGSPRSGISSPGHVTPRLRELEGGDQASGLLVADPPGDQPSFLAGPAPRGSSRQRCPRKQPGPQPGAQCRAWWSSPVERDPRRLWPPKRRTGTHVPSSGSHVPESGNWRTSLTQIGELFKGRDQFHVIHSIRVVENRVNVEPTFRQQVQELEAELGRIP